MAGAISKHPIAHQSQQSILMKSRGGVILEIYMFFNITILRLKLNA